MFNNTFKRTWVSPVVALSFALVGSTGVLMLFDVHAAGIHGLHEWMGVIMVAAGVVHLLLNGKALLVQFKHRSASVAFAAVTALALILVLAGGGEGPHRGGSPIGPQSENAPWVAPGDTEQ